ncbi:MAG: DUF1697 domain-containing protein [Alphaproteobacteria bacterium]|nr:DUF1697 domain-containing protein [Alphaproteobacteria bacterium]
MVQHVAFLRSVNVGKRTVKGPELVAAFEALGLVRPWTFLASGNVGFEAPSGSPVDLGDRLTAHLGEVLGFEVPTVVRTLEALSQAAAGDPFDGWGTRFVAFARLPLPDGTLEALAQVGSAADRFAVDGADLQWATAGGYSASVFGGPLLEKVVGVPLTVRKATTLGRLVAKAAAS